MTSQTTTPRPDFLKSDPSFSPTLFALGLQNRRNVVGPQFLHSAFTQTTEFTLPIQQLITQYCWGWAWGRSPFPSSSSSSSPSSGGIPGGIPGGLSFRDRSLLNLAMLMALNRSTEFGAHVRGARRNGVSEVEIRETILHAMVYCGVPAGVEAGKVAERVLGEMETNGEIGRELGGKVDLSEFLD